MASPDVTEIVIIVKGTQNSQDDGDQQHDAADRKHQQINAGNSQPDAIANECPQREDITDETDGNEQNKGD